jgi:hypothetical protein
MLSGGQDGELHCSVEVQVAADVAHVRITGRLCAVALRNAKARALKLVDELGPVAGWLVDYSAAEVLATRADLAAIAVGQGNPAERAVPAAMLVKPCDLPLFDAHLWDVAWRGVVLRPFLCRAEAIAWITAEARTAAEARVPLLPAE